MEFRSLIAIDERVFVESRLTMDETRELIDFLKLIGDHRTNTAGAFAATEAVLQLDKASIQKVRARLAQLGIKPEADGLMQATVEGRLLLQVSETTWMRVLLGPTSSQGYQLELLLQKWGLDLRAILKVHDQLEPPAKPTTCPRCGTQFADGQEVSVIGGGSPWPRYGGSGESSDSRWPEY